MTRSIMITGASCTGKSTLINQLVDATNMVRVPGYTTRKRRENERAGFDFFFLECPTVFAEMFKDGHFIDPDFSVTMYADQFYGSPAQWISMPFMGLSILFSPTSTVTAAHVKRTLGKRVLWTHLFANEPTRKARLLVRDTPQPNLYVRLYSGDSQGEMRDADLNIDTGALELAVAIRMIIDSA